MILVIIIMKSMIVTILTHRAVIVTITSMRTLIIYSRCHSTQTGRQHQKQGRFKLAVRSSPPTILKQDLKYKHNDKIVYRIVTSYRSVNIRITKIYLGLLSETPSASLGQELSFMTHIFSQRLIGCRTARLIINIPDIEFLCANDLSTTGEMCTVKICIRFNRIIVCTFSSFSSLSFLLLICYIFQRTSSTRLSIPLFAPSS